MPGQSSRRLIILAAFAAAPVLALVSDALQPNLSGSAAHQLAVIAAHRSEAEGSAVTFVLMQLPLAIVALAIATFVGTRARRLANIGATLAVLSALGHAAVGGSMLTAVTMSNPALARTQMADLLGRFHHSAPYHAFALLGLAGFILGWLLLAIALWRSRLVPRAAAAAIPAFILLEFLVSAAVPRASLVGVLCFAAALYLIARRLDLRPDKQTNPTPNTTPTAAWR